MNRVVNVTAIVVTAPFWLPSWLALTAASTAVRLYLNARSEE